MDLGNNGQKPTLRVGVTMDGTLQIRTLRPQQQLKNFNMRLPVICDSRILGFDKHIESFRHERLDPSQRTVTFGNDTVQNCCSCQSPCSTWVCGPQNSLLGCAYSTAGRDKVYDQGKRILCTLDKAGKPTTIESRKANCRRPLMAVTDMTDCGRWVCFGPQRQGFSFDPRTGQKIEFTPTLGGWDLTMKLEPLDRGNKILNKANKKRAAATRMG